MKLSAMLYKKFAKISGTIIKTVEIRLVNSLQATLVDLKALKTKRH